MNAFEYAMQMEIDGRKFYQEQSAAMEDSALKKIYDELADDEQRHYEIFKALSKGKSGDVGGAFKTTILETTKNVFQQIKAEGGDIAEFPDGVKKAWEKAREIEDKSEKFYREQAKKADSQEAKDLWNKIAHEEHKHWVALDHVIQFLNRPHHWLENAEWSHMGE